MMPGKYDTFALHTYSWTQSKGTKHAIVTVPQTFKASYSILQVLIQTDATLYTYAIPFSSQVARLSPGSESVVVCALPLQPNTVVG